ncbi:MAG: glutathione S-transferase family protein [Candidatus Eiseniibacteriota bacterium]
MAVELYHFWSSVCSVRCRMALEEKGVTWQSRYVDLFKFDQMKPDYLALNPDGVVPTLVHDGAPIRESTIINEYIDAAFPGPRLVPADPLEAARMREFIRACEDGFIGIVLLTMVKYILPKLRNRWSDEELRAQAERRPAKFYRDIHGRGVRGEITAKELSDAEATCQGLLDRLEAALDPGPWIVGDFSLADITVAPYVYRLHALGKGRFWSADHRPRVHDWYERLSRRPAFVTAVSWPDESGGGYEEVGLTTRTPAN